MSRATRSGRITRKPTRYQDETFVPGSGIVGCDNYDHGYNDGHFWTTYKDSRERAADYQYLKDLEKAKVNDEVTINLPSDVGNLISELTNKRSHYRHDIAFIVSDNIEPDKMLHNDEDESEWETGDETSDEEWDEDME